MSESPSEQFCCTACDHRDIIVHSLLTTHCTYCIHAVRSRNRCVYRTERSLSLQQRPRSHPNVRFTFRCQTRLLHYAIFSVNFVKLITQNRRQLYARNVMSHLSLFRLRVCNPKCKSAIVAPIINATARRLAAADGTIALATTGRQTDRLCFLSA